MTPLIIGAFIEGVVQAAIIAGLFYLLGARRMMWLAAALLIVAGALYVKFAVSAGQLNALPIEIVGLLITVGFAATGMLRRSPSILAIGWALHPIWDVALHTRGIGTYAPEGYVVACIGFDFVLAAGILWVASRSKARLASTAA
jgi:hypothetical protein